MIDSKQINLSSTYASVKNDTKNSVMVFNLPIIQSDENVHYNLVSVATAQIPSSYYIINDNNNILIINNELHHCFSIVTHTYIQQYFKMKVVICPEV